MKYILKFLSVLMLLLFISIIFSNAQQINAIGQAGGSEQDGLRSVISDDQGNLYVFIQTGESPFNFFGTSYSSPYDNGFSAFSIVGKLDSLMNPIWVTSFGIASSSTKTEKSMAIDEDYNLYITHRGASDRATIKLDSFGNTIWNVPLGGISMEYDGNEQIKLLQASDYNDNMGLGIDNINTTVITIDTSGNYMSHFSVEDSNFTTMTVIGANDTGFYGHRRQAVYPGTNANNRWEIFTCDSLGNITDYTLAGFDVALYEMVYDFHYQKYYLYGTFKISDGLVTITDSISYLLKSAAILQFDTDLELTKTKVFNQASSSPSDYSAGMKIKPHDGDLFIALNGHGLGHLGQEHYLGTTNEFIGFAKLDHNLTTQWSRVFETYYYAKSLDGVIVTPQGIYFGGKFDAINELNTSVNGSDDVFIFKVEDLKKDSYGYLEGKVFIDLNQNGIDDDEAGFTTTPIVGSAIPSSIAYTDQEGNFSLTSTLGTNVVRSLELPDHWAYSTPDSIVTDVNQLDTLIQGLDIGMYPIPGINDVEVIIKNLSPARIGFNVGYQINYKNNINDTLSGKVKYIQDNDLIYLGAEPSPDTINGDTLIWNYTGLEPNGTRSITILDSLVADIDLLSEVLVNTVGISPYNDELSENNRDTIFHLVTGSYDPNDISVSPSCLPSSFSVTDQELEYRIRFQNTGTDTAFTVILKNTIALELDLNTFEVYNSSHPVNVQIEGRELQLFFNDILLPDSTTNSVASNGFFTYKIKLSSVWNPTAIFGNSAEIYFDYNPPIYTNSAVVGIGGTYESSPIETTVCISFSPSPSAGSWTESGIYRDTLQSYLGCDSIMVYDLTIIESIIEMSSITACDSFANPLGTDIWYESGIYMDTVFSDTGCDSIFQLDLTIINSSVTNIQETACGSFTASDGSILDEEGIYSFTLVNHLGCDSIIHLDLILDTIPEISILENDNILFTNTGMDSYQWMDCANAPMSIIVNETSENFSPNSDGSYAVEVTSGTCTVISDCLDFEISTSNLNLETLEEIRIIPNPAKDLFLIQTDQPENISHIRLISSNGKMLKEILIKTEQDLLVPINTLEAGIYFVEIEFLSGYKTIRKWIKI